MIDVGELVREITEALEARADPERKKWSGGIAPTSMEILGIKVPDLRVVVKDVARRLKKEPAGEVIELAKALVSSGLFELRHVAYELLSRHKKAMAALDLEDLEELGRGIDNWGSVDGFGCLLAGPVWREGRIPDEVVRGWTLSEDRWWRRAAVVCTVALNQKARGGTGDPERTLDICRMVVSDHDDMVVKALSWALRELSKREKELVSGFLEKYEDQLASRVLREVRRKIDTGTKSGK